MDQGTREVRRFGVGPCGGPPCADCGQKIVHVFGVSTLAAKFLAFGWPSLALGAEECAESSTTRKDHVALGPIENVSIVETVHAIGRERVVFVDHDLTIREIVSDDHVVGVVGTVAVKNHSAASG